MTARSLITCVGDVTVARRCGYCEHCRRGTVAFDRWAGLGRGVLTPGGQRLAALAGSKLSYDEASEHLEQLCGIRVSDQTIRRACEAAGERAIGYLQHHEQATTPVREARGLAECSTDGAKVNTTGGWKEIRAIVVSKREPGEPASVRQWKNRPLPAPTATLAWAAIIDSDQVGAQLGEWSDRLGWTADYGRGVNVVADGAKWVWKQATLQWPDHDGCLDIWHLMEHLHDAGRALHSEGDAARRWADLQRAALFRYGAIRYLKKHLLPQVRAHRQLDAAGPPAQALRSLLGYLWSHRDRLTYRHRLRRGLTIGSGQIEGVCKNTLNRRLRKNNPRWRPDNANRIAALCCLHTSQQWDTFWQTLN